MLTVVLCDVGSTAGHYTAALRSLSESEFSPYNSSHLEGVTKEMKGKKIVLATINSLATFTQGLSGV